MTCVSIINDYNVGCQSGVKTWVQRAVLVNKNDVKDYVIKRSRYDINNNFTCSHSIAFELYEGLRGFEIKSIETIQNIFGSFEKETDDGTPYYNHIVQILANGWTLETICFLNQLDKGNYFCALQLSDGKVIIFGFENGLRTNNWKFDVVAGAGGSLLNLQSASGESESQMPYFYESINSTPSQDFKDLFANNSLQRYGSFNNDFNNDFEV